MIWVCRPKHQEREKSHGCHPRTLQNRIQILKSDSSGKYLLTSLMLIMKAFNRTLIYFELFFSNTVKVKFELIMQTSKVEKKNLWMLKNHFLLCTVIITFAKKNWKLSVWRPRTSVKLLILLLKMYCSERSCNTDLCGFCSRTIVAGLHLNAL